MPNFFFVGKDKKKYHENVILLIGPECDISVTY